MQFDRVHKYLATAPQNKMHFLLVDRVLEFAQKYYR
jgi:hypothetical protein